jgi:CO/xanthine dehydrogenase FAD-binding subunit
MFDQPHSLEEALAIRATMGEDVTPIAGGTDIVVAMNRTGRGPKHFLDLTHIQGHSDVRRDNGAWVLGGGATFTQLSKLPVRALAEAAMTVGGPAIRNCGTIAGNLGTASPAGDGCVAIMAVDAEIELRHATRGRRVIPIAEYFTGYRKTALVADELITSVRIPADWRTAWYKIGKRGSINISLVCAAIGLSPKGDVRIAFGCVGPSVIRAREAEAIVEREGLTDKSIEAAAQSAMKEVSPIDDHRSSAAYRRAMSGVLVRRLLRQLRDDVAQPPSAVVGGARPK